MSMTKISTITVGVGGTNTIQFTSIPDSYDDLYIIASTRNSSTLEHVLIGFNGSTSNFTGRYVTGYNTNTASGEYARYIGNTSTSTYTANTFGITNIYIPNYTSSQYKSISGESSGENNSAVYWTTVFSSNVWSSGSAITSIELTNETGSTILEGSTATLYGITKGSGGATVS